MDLTMISTPEVNGVNHFSITCISGERGQAQVELDIKRDNKILVFPKEPNFRVHKTRNQVEARDFRDLDHIGIFYCESTEDVSPLETVTMINNFGRSRFRPRPAVQSVQLLSIQIQCVFYFLTDCIRVSSANFVPAHLTLTASLGETANLSMQLLNSQRRDVTWKYNGKPNEKAPQAS